MEAETLEHDAEKCEAAFPGDKRVAFARRSNNELSRDWCFDLQNFQSIDLKFDDGRMRSRVTR